MAQLNCCLIEPYASQSNEQLLKLVSRKKTFQNKVNTLKADFTAEDQKRKKLEEEVSRARSESGGLFKQARENEDMQSKLRTMENRVEKTMTVWMRISSLLLLNRELSHLLDRSWPYDRGVIGS